MVKKASYVAIRLAVTLCILWLLTSGWNMITVARRPVCLPKAAGLQGWEAGTTCQAGRAGMAFAMIALYVSDLPRAAFSLTRTQDSFLYVVRHALRRAASFRSAPAEARVQAATRPAPNHARSLWPANTIT